MAVSTPTVAGQVLTSAYVNNNINSGLTYITSATFTAGTTTTGTSFNSAFSAAYDNYKIVFNSNGNGTAAFYEFRLRAAGTPPAAGYYGNAITMTSNAATVSGSGFVNTAYFGLGSQQAGADRCHTEMEVFDPFLAQMTSFRMSAGTYVGGFGYNYTAQGQHNVATSYDGFAISLPSGSFAGTVTVYGYRKP
jgi:hypothetical protein